MNRFKLKPGRFLPAEDIILQNTVDGTEPIFSPNLLSVFVSSSVIRNANLINSDVRKTADFGCYLWLETKTVLLQFEALYHLGIEQLVARFHIGQIQVGEHV